MSHCMLSAFLSRFGWAQPGTLLPVQHFFRQVRLLFDQFPCELWAFAKFVAYDFVHDDQLPLFQVIENLGIMVCVSAFYFLKLLSRCVGY